MQKLTKKIRMDPSIIVAGVDEAGRGPLAGPVAAAAVILDPKRRIIGLADSKLLTEKRREELYQLIVERSIAWSVGMASHTEIDSINILRATLLAMQRAVLGLTTIPEHVCVDGNICPDIPYPVTAYVNGDQYIDQISAASIIAKVTRDRIMVDYDATYPGYGFASHKGYSTREHLANLRQKGAIAIHRRSFEPVRLVVEQMEPSLD